MKIYQNIIKIISPLTIKFFNNNLNNKLDKRFNKNFHIKIKDNINYISNKKYKQILAENNLFYDLYDNKYIDLIDIKNKLLFNKKCYNTDSLIYNNFKSSKLNKSKKLKKYNINKEIFDDKDIYYNFCTKIYKKSLKHKLKLLSAEHIYPQSYTKHISKSIYDIHNIYLTSQYFNSYRSNYKFIDEKQKNLYNLDTLLCLDNNLHKDIEIDCIIYEKQNNYKNNKSKIFIPCHSSRGAIARSIAYMIEFYPGLHIEDIIDIDILILWNELYPPNIYEIEKNKLCKYVQGNSNIFIDNPKNIKYL